MLYNQLVKTPTFVELLEHVIAPVVEDHFAAIASEAELNDWVLFKFSNAVNCLIIIVGNLTDSHSSRIKLTIELYLARQLFSI